jgi:hypothetical protein
LSQIPCVSGAASSVTLINVDEQLTLSVKISLRATHDGGRRTGIAAGYRSSWTCPWHGELLDAPLITLTPPEIQPGGEGEGEIEPLAPQLWDGRVKPGDELVMSEGPPPVGQAVVVRVTRR